MSLRNSTAQSLAIVAKPLSFATKPFGLRDLKRRDDRHGRAEKRARRAGHERGMRSVPPRCVVRAAAGDARVRVQVDLIGAAIQGLEARLDQERVPARVGDVGAGDPVFRRGPLVGVRDDVFERVLRRHRDDMIRRVALEIHEGRAVRDDVLHVLHVGDVETRIEDLAGDPFRDRKPDFPVETGGGPDGELVSRRPRRFAARTVARGDAGRAGRLRLDQRRRSQQKRGAERDAGTETVAAHAFFLQARRQDGCGFDRARPPVASPRHPSLWHRLLSSPYFQQILDGADV